MATVSPCFQSIRDGAAHNSLQVRKTASFVATRTRYCGPYTPCCHILEFETNGLVTALHEAWSLVSRYLNSSQPWGALIDFTLGPPNLSHLFLHLDHPARSFPQHTSVTPVPICVPNSFAGAGIVWIDRYGPEPQSRTMSWDRKLSRSGVLGHIWKWGP